MIHALDYSDIYERIRLHSLIEHLKNVLKKVEFLKSAYVPERTLIRAEDPFAVYGTMPAYCKDLDLFVTKVAAFVDGAAKSVNSLVCAFIASTGKPLAVLNGEAITNLKCAAITGVVNDYCASENSKVLGIIGCGVQAREQLRGILAVRKINQVKIYSRNRNNIFKFISEMQQSSDFNGVDFEGCNTIEDTASDVDILSTATTSHKPLIGDFNIKNYLHINVMGAHTIDSREINLQMLNKAQLIVENKELAINEAGKIHEKAIEIQELHLVSQKNQLKNSFTVFSSTGYALLDLVTTSYVINNLFEPQ